MIRSLQIKITVIMASVLLAVFAVFFVTLNIRMQISSYEKAESVLQILADYDGRVFLTQKDENDLKDVSDETEMDGENLFLNTPPSGYTLFYIKVDGQGQMIDANYDMIYDMTQESLNQYKEDILSQNKQSGVSGDYQFLVQPKAYGAIIACAQRGNTVEMLRDLVTISSVVAGISCIVLLLISVMLARWAVKPVNAAFDRQRQFISDASHELKTPLTVITTNAEMLRQEIGDNTELFHIQDQAGRMNRLIHDMLTLAKTDEDSQEVPYIEFDLSSVVLHTVLGFESVAYEAGRKLTYEIEEGLRYTGNEVRIRHVVSIFTDNAIKHSNQGGEIHIQLKKEDGKITLTFYNTGEGIKETEKEKIFERFYRSDESRSRETGGYGLGLAIAKSIVQQHGGKIKVTTKSGEWIRFMIKL